MHDYYELDAKTRRPCQFSCTAVCAGLQLMGGPVHFFLHICVFFLMYVCVCLCLFVSVCDSDMTEADVFILFMLKPDVLVNLVVQQFAQVCN